MLQNTCLDGHMIYYRWKAKKKLKPKDKKNSKAVERKNKIMSYFHQKRQTLKHPLRIMVAQDE